MIETAVASLAMIALGAAIGITGGVFGFGGGAIAIPVLGLLCGLDQHTAQGTAVAMVVPNVMLSFWRYRQHGHIDMRIAGALAVGATASAYPAALFANSLNGHALRLAFAAMLVVFAALIAHRVLRRTPVGPPRKSLAWGWSIILGVVGGITSGLFGVGGALIAPPALTAFFGVRQTTAQALGLALVTPGSVIALAAYAAAGNVDWQIGVPLAVGGVLSISIGVALAHRLPERRLRLGFCGVLVATAALLALRA